MKSLICSLMALLLASCALPETNVRTGSPRPAVMVKGAPVDSILVVDGLSMGAALQFDGNPKILTVEEGLHQIEIRHAATVLHIERVFISNGETRTITVNTGAQ